MRWIAPLLLVAVGCDDPSFDHPDAQPLGVSCLELTNYATCAAGDTIVVGDEVYVAADSKVDETITCQGVPCSMKYDVSPLAAGSLTIHVALQSKVNSDHNEIDLPTLNVRALDRIDTACFGCTGVKLGDNVEVSATGILDGAPRDLYSNDFDEQSSGPGTPAQGLVQAGAMTWTWINVQPGLHTMTIDAGGQTASTSFTVP